MARPKTVYIPTAINGIPKIHIKVPDCIAPAVQKTANPRKNTPNSKRYILCPDRCSPRLLFPDHKSISSYESSLLIRDMSLSIFISPCKERFISYQRRRRSRSRCCFRFLKAAPFCPRRRKPTRRRKRRNPLFQDRQAGRLSPARRGRQSGASYFSAPN